MRTAASLVLAFAAVAVLPATAHADDKRPALSIKVDDATNKAESGKVQTYTVKLRNLDATEHKGLVLSQSLPAGATLDDASDGGRSDAASGQIVWTVDVPAGQEVTRTLKAKLGDLPKGRGIASTACARRAADKSSVVCSTDMDNVTSAAAAAKADGGGFGGAGLFGGLGVAALLAGGGGWWFLKGRHNVKPAETKTEA